MPATGLDGAAVKEPGGDREGDHAIHVIEPVRFEAGAGQDGGRIGAERAEQRGDFDQSADTLAPNAFLGDCAGTIGALRDASKW